MNAADQATSLETANKIAALVNLMKREFPGVKVNLRPWINDPETLEWMDPESIDMGFNLPPGHTLLQLRLQGQRLIGVDASCFGPFGDERWKFSTIGSWRFLGSSPPAPEFQDKLKRICREVFAIFNPAGLNGDRP
ncbi:hypothetical protein [Lyngbya confervoides]|uniref:Uncharacterized protein n=1 Tax=Lyngbya confervoides BDU141951 TaxID=1574623 RepID=A0ABD4T2T2_9CYAN|nr:hypothetical protein [Lyngbya confervoides]MCM1982852.1 hypothetical protein [Lyngbya confervoides BDU141951]